MKKLNAILLALPLVFTSACSGGSSSEAPYTDDTTFNGTEYYDKVETRVGFDNTYEGNISENLDGGRLNDDYWNTLEGVWQNDSSVKPHAGMKNRNLFYIKDGDSTYLGFRGRGLYCYDEDMQRASNGQALPEGACIITKDKLIPGRFEIEMAAFPRHGGVSACWTYLTETGNEATSQNEIDIEIGGASGTSTFTTFWATSWTRHDNTQNVHPDVSSLLYMNDGKFHKYTFDWYTEYLDTGLGRVDWFIDGVLVATVRGSLVPSVEMPLWIGLWFPNWTNDATFDTDYMLMKSFNFTAFDNSQYCEESRSGSGYTQADPSASNIGSKEYSEVTNLNRVGNPSFESFAEVPLNRTIGGWETLEISEGTYSQSDDHVSGSHSLKMDATNGITYLQQEIEEVYPGYRYDIKLQGKLASGASQAEIWFTNRLGGTISGSSTVINLDSSNWKEYTASVTAPENSRGLLIRLVTSSGEAYYDDISAIYRGN